MLALILQQNRAVLQQDHITMAMITLQTTELIREVNIAASQGCALQQEEDGQVKRARKSTELWHGLQELHYYMRKRSFALFHNFMMTQQVQTGHQTQISNRVAEFLAKVCSDLIRV